MLVAKSRLAAATRDERRRTAARSGRNIATDGDGGDRGGDRGDGIHEERREEEGGQVEPSDRRLRRAR